MPVQIPDVTEKRTGTVRQVTLGATAAEGGTRTKTVTVGGETTLPFLQFEGQMPNPPIVAVEIQDYEPKDWSAILREAWGDVIRDPATWAQKAEECGADLISLHLRGVDNDENETTSAQVAETIEKVLGATGLPLLVYGAGQPERDNELLVAVAEAAAGERIAMGVCEEKNYRTLVAAALAHNQLVIARSPIDINLAKQLNILISDMAMPLDRVLMDPTTGALGYGLEYTYSVMERLRLAAFQGDGMTQQPMICTVGEESWRQKESKFGAGMPSAWGDWAKRGVTWETITAVTLIHSGADIVTIRHPESVSLIKKSIAQLMTVRGDD